MKLLLGTTGWTLIIIGLVGLVIILIIFFIFLPRIIASYKKNNYKKIYYKKIRKIAELNDYYLINNLTLHNGENEIYCRIDHILFGEKYIYVIKDIYHKGAIKGDKEDNKWIVFDKNGNKSEINNPLMTNYMRVNKLYLLTQIDLSFLISIVILNDDCVINNIENLSSENNFIVPRKKFIQLINKLESKDIKKMNENQLAFAVKDISRLYGSQAEINIDGKEKQ